METIVVRIASIWFGLRLGYLVPQEREDEGQSLVEYALILVFVAIACIAAVAALGEATLVNLWNRISSTLVPALG
ncbi:MAG: Flp family type IVb pilin [Chloroflexota bacterium]|nr:Flp family type IVb pilin [Chloroflexota bacterium]